MITVHLLAHIPAMMSALERTAVSVTSDGRTERGPNWHNIGLVLEHCNHHAGYDGATYAAS